MTFARSAAVFGHWLLPGSLDKTPLSIYAAAVSMHFTAAHVSSAGLIDVPVRQGEFAGRLPNVFAGVVLVSLSFQLTRSLFPRDKWTPYLAALLTALSPMLVEFSASAFTDTLMVAFGLASGLAAARGRPMWSGLLLALSVASKQQGLYFLPLAVTLSALWATRSLPPEAGGVKRWPLPLSVSPALIRFLIGFLPDLAALLLWDAARPGTSVFILGSVNNAPDHWLAHRDEILPRLRTWLQYAAPIFGAGWLTAAMLLAGLYGLRKQLTRAETILAAFAAGYFGLHWLAAFNIYDRYLLPLIPVVSILAARGMDRWAAPCPGPRNGMRRHTPLARLYPAAVQSAAALCALVMSVYALSIHRDRPNRGIIELANYLNAKPLGTIVYDHWLGWELGYYLGAWTDKRLTYFPTPRLLAENALLHPDPVARYFVAPEDETTQPWLDALAAWGFTVQLEYEYGGLLAYTVIPAWAQVRQTWGDGRDAAASGSSWRGPVLAAGETE